MTTEKTTAVLLCNLGTPDAPTPAALRRYLSQFLSDPRVVEIPRLFWLPLLHGVILRVRPRRSAAKYASVWSDTGSPLAAWTQRQAELLGQRLRESGLPAPVLPAMRYGQPAVGTQLQALLDAGVQRVLVLPCTRSIRLPPRPACSTVSRTGYGARAGTRNCALSTITTITPTTLRLWPVACARTGRAKGNAHSIW